MLSCSVEVPMTRDIFRAGSPAWPPIESIELLDESECCRCLLRELLLLAEVAAGLAPIHIFKGCTTFGLPEGAILKTNKKIIFKKMKAEIFDDPKLVVARKKYISQHKKLKTYVVNAFVFPDFFIVIETP